MESCALAQAQRAMPASDTAGTHPGQGHLCLATDAVVLLTCLGCHTWGQLGYIPGGAKYTKSVCIRQRTKFDGVVAMRLGCHVSLSQAGHNFSSVLSKVSSDPIQDRGHGGDGWDAGCFCIHC